MKEEESGDKIRREGNLLKGIKGGGGEIEGAKVRR
jgi:hypothetical protein